DARRAAARRPRSPGTLGDGRHANCNGHAPKKIGMTPRAARSEGGGTCFWVVGRTFLSVRVGSASRLVMLGTDRNVRPTQSPPRENIDRRHTETNDPAADENLAPYECGGAVRGADGGPDGARRRRSRMAAAL